MVERASRLPCCIMGVRKGSGHNVPTNCLNTLKTDFSEIVHKPCSLSLIEAVHEVPYLHEYKRASITLISTFKSTRKILIYSSARTRELLQEVTYATRLLLPLHSFRSLHPLHFHPHALLPPTQMATYPTINYKYDMGDILYTNRFSITSDISYRIVTKSVNLTNFSPIYYIEEAEHSHANRAWISEAYLRVPKFQLHENVRFERAGDKLGTIVKITLHRNGFFYSVEVDDKTWQNTREGDIKDDAGMQTQEDVMRLANRDYHEWKDGAIVSMKSVSEASPRG